MRGLSLSTVGTDSPSEFSSRTGISSTSLMGRLKLTLGLVNGLTFVALCAGINSLITANPNGSVLGGTHFSPTLKLKLADPSNNPPSTL